MCVFLSFFSVIGVLNKVSKRCESVCVCLRERECGRAECAARLRERGRERECVCVSEILFRDGCAGLVFERCVSVCVCVRERARRERERECVCARDRVCVQGGEDSQDALICRSFFRKRATNYMALFRKNAL